MLSAALASIYKFCTVINVIKDLGIQVKIIHDDFGLLEAFQSLDRKQTDISRTSADNIDFTCWHVSVWIVLSLTNCVIHDNTVMHESGRIEMSAKAEVAWYMNCADKRFRCAKIWIGGCRSSHCIHSTDAADMLSAFLKSDIKRG